MPFLKDSFNLHICVRHALAHKGRCNECALHFKVLKLKKLEKVALKALKAWDESEKLETKAAADALIAFARELEVEKRFPTIVSFIRKLSIETQKDSSKDRIWLQPLDWASEQQRKIINGCE